MKLILLIIIILFLSIRLIKKRQNFIVNPINFAFTVGADRGYDVSGTKGDYRQLKKLTTYQPCLSRNYSSLYNCIAKKPIIFNRGTKNVAPTKINVNYQTSGTINDLLPINI